MVDVNNVSRMRKLVTPPAAVAPAWKASRYRLWGDGAQARLEADPLATWKRVDPFASYAPAGRRRDSGEDAPAHVHFLKLKGVCMDEGKRHLFDKAAKLFADRHGLLGLVREYFSPPVMPSRVESFCYVAPDAVLDGKGRLRTVDPATEGKDRLEQLFRERFGRTETIGLRSLVLPHELRFPVRTVYPFDVPLPMGETSILKTSSWEDVKGWYGIRFLLDRHAYSGVSLVTTSELVGHWAYEMGGFPSKPRAVLRGLCQRISSGVTPDVALDEDGNPGRGWRCSSLMKALYLMLYLDGTEDVELRKCASPGCPNFFRAGVQSRGGLYCPPPPGKRQSPCASRASSRMYRERRRSRGNPDAT